MQVSAERSLLQLCRTQPRMGKANVFVSFLTRKVVGHREGNPVSFFSLLPNLMKMITFAYKKLNPIA